ncbi:MAG: MgtC/SapB family protein [Candidatus Micrarchaeota archaeon]
MFEVFDLPVVRLIIAALAGLFIGFTRRRMNVGGRTFALIALGSAIFTIVSVETAIYAVEGGLVPTADPTRVIAQIVSGIGFLGVGVIWKSNARVGGLTTAATIWVTAGLGILAGLAMWDLLLASFVISLLTLHSKHALKED